MDARRKLKQPRTTSKYRRLYGMTLQQMADVIGTSRQAVHERITHPDKREDLLRQVMQGLHEQRKP